MRKPARIPSFAARLLALSLLVGLLLTGLLATCRGHYGSRKVDTTKGRIDVPAGTQRLRFEVPPGTVSLETGSAGAITFEQELQRAADDQAGLEELAALQLELHVAPGAEAGTLRLVSERLDKRVDRSTRWVEQKAFVRVPPGLAVEVVLESGHASATELRGDLSIATAHGDVLLKRCHGAAKVRTGGGHLAIDAHEGSLDAETRDGKIVAFVSRLGPDGLRLVSGNGGIQAHLPRDSAFDLDMRAPDGKLDATWQLPIRRELGGVFMAGRVGDGGPRVYIEAWHGSVSLRAEARAQ